MVPLPLTKAFQESLTCTNDRNVEEANIAHCDAEESVVAGMIHRRLESSSSHVVNFHLTGKISEPLRRRLNTAALSLVG